MQSLDPAVVGVADVWGASSRLTATMNAIMEQAFLRKSREDGVVAGEGRRRGAGVLRRRTPSAVPQNPHRLALSTALIHVYAQPRLRSHAGVDPEFPLDRRTM